MLKKGLFMLGVTLLFEVSQISAAFGAAYEGGGLGTRALSMAGAFIGEASDWTAVYWNPAGLAQLKGRGIGSSFEYVPLSGSDGNSLANPFPPLMNADQGDIFFQFPHPTTGDRTEPLSFNEKDIDVTVYLPGLGGYTPFKGLVVAGAVYVPLGYSSEWKDAVAENTISASYQVETYEIVYNLSVSREVMSNLSLGAGLNLLQGKYERHARKKTPLYTYNFDMDGDGIGLEGVLGIWYKIRPYLALGGVYRSGGELSFDGKAKMGHSLVDVVPDESSDYTQKFKHPATYGLGLAFRPIPSLTLTTDWVRTDWSKQRKDIDFDQPDQTFLKDKDERSDWEDTDRFRVGLEYRVNNRWSLRGGFFVDPSPVPDKAVSLTNLVDVDRNFYTLGAGLDLNNWQLNLGYVRADGDREINGVLYERDSYGFQTTCVYQF
ncbi:MAG: outer membrane protein transport protein [bacterium]